MKNEQFLQNQLFALQRPVLLLMSSPAIRCGGCDKAGARAFRGKESGRVVHACSSHCAQRAASATAPVGDSMNSLSETHRQQLRRDMDTKWEDDTIRRQVLVVAGKALIQVADKLDPLELGESEVFVSVAEIRAFANDLGGVCAQLKALVPKLPENSPRQVGDEPDNGRIDRGELLYRMQIFYVHLRDMTKAVRNGNPSLRHLDEVCRWAAQIHALVK